MRYWKHLTFVIMTRLEHCRLLNCNQIHYHCATKPVEQGVLTGPENVNIVSNKGRSLPSSPAPTVSWAWFPEPQVGHLPAHIGLKPSPLEKLCLSTLRLRPNSSTLRHIELMQYRSGFMSLRFTSGDHKAIMASLQFWHPRRILDLIPALPVTRSAIT